MINPACKRFKVSEFFLVKNNECGVLEGINIIPVENLNDLVDYLYNKLIIDAYSVKYFQLENVSNYIEDVSDIKGQPEMKRAVEIAAA